MEECRVCHAPETKAVLFEVVSIEGVVKVCGKCYGKESFPLVKKNSGSGEIREQSVRERMIKISGVNPKGFEKIPEKSQQDAILKRIVEFNSMKDFTGFSNDADSKKDFVYNFHWIVMRGRRNRHITQEQLARAIKEPERAIRLVEKGYVPKDLRVISKIENYLGIMLRKQGHELEIDTRSYPKMVSEDFEVPEGADFDGAEDAEIDEQGYLVLKEGDRTNLTISDLQEMKRKRDMEFL